jgi:hypothetical protein
MRARLEALLRDERVVEELHRRLEQVARASVVSRGEGISASYLVRSEDQPAFERVVAEFGRMHPQLTTLCTGPWAPYSFAAPEAV